MLDVAAVQRSSAIHHAAPSSRNSSSFWEVNLATTKRILFAATMVFAIPAAAHNASPQADSPTATDSAQTQVAPEGDVVEGATPEREALIEQCSNHKFETMIEIDPVKKRSTRVKLCSNPGASDADWVKTLEAAIAELEERRMPPAAKGELVAQLKGEIAKYAKPQRVLAGPINLGQASLAPPLNMPTERFETSVLPSLDPPKVAATAVAGSAPVTAPPNKAMAFKLKCLARGQKGTGGTCDFLEKETTLVVSAVQGLEKGGTLRFRRRGDERGEVLLNAMQPGQSVHVKLPSELCKGVSSSKVEIELLAPGSTGSVAAREGPYGLRC